MTAVSQNVTLKYKYKSATEILHAFYSLYPKCHYGNGFPLLAINRGDDTVG